MARLCCLCLGKIVLCYRNLCKDSFTHLLDHQHKTMSNPLLSLYGDFKPNSSGHRLDKFPVTLMRARLVSSLQNLAYWYGNLIVSGRGQGRYCNTLREIWVICRNNSKLQVVTVVCRTPSKLYPTYFILSISLIIAYWSF